VSCEIEIQSGADARGPLFEVDAGSHDAADVADAVVGVLPSGDDVSVWVDHPTDELNSALSNIGLEVQRDLYKMAVDLPLATTSSIDTRPFKPRQDESAWMEVNNRAFSWHREQSGWTLADVEDRIAEPWFDPAGFLLHERDDKLLGFCWTKLHLDLEPPEGEIYVVAVDPEGQGRGLGRELTAAGLESIHARGITNGILYVDADNTPAVTLYLSLGFGVDTVRRLYINQET
jgi:mycothiol synthase